MREHDVQFNQAHIFLVYLVSGQRRLTMDLHLNSLTHAQQ